MYKNRIKSVEKNTLESIKLPNILPDTYNYKYIYTGTVCNQYEKSSYFLFVVNRFSNIFLYVFCVAGSAFPVAGSASLVAGSALLVAGSASLVAGSASLVAGSAFSVAGAVLLVTGFIFSVLQGIFRAYTEYYPAYRVNFRD
ncbi:MAG: hypothetical protein LBH90_05255 [Tannerella sp.]|jgi:hypothetical protein|nr:hypothetical protein [Tannerella sp.]